VLIEGVAGKFATAAFSIGIDGAGINHDGHVAGVG
jgi:hypothetical protein